MHILLHINTYSCIVLHISLAFGTKYAEIRKFMRKYAKICQNMQNMQKKNAIYAEKFKICNSASPVSGVPVPFQQALHWSSQQRIRVNTSLLINTLGFALFESGAGRRRPPGQPVARRLPHPCGAAAEPALARPRVAGRPQQILVAAQLRLPTQPCMVSRVQLPRPPPRRQPTPPPQHPGSKQPNTPSIRYTAVHVPHPTCDPQ